jgi:hypothetical protein
MNAVDDLPRDDDGLTFRIVRTPAGWRIVGHDSLTISTLYLSLEAALSQARSMTEVMIQHGQRARVVVDAGDLPE